MKILVGVKAAEDRVVVWVEETLDVVEEEEVKAYRWS